MTPQQQQIIIDNMWVVDAALKKQNIKDDDMRQQALLYMCRIIEKFDASFGVKFSTFAYKNIYLYIKRQRKAEIKVNSRICKEIVIGRVCEPNFAIIELETMCDEQEKELLNLKMQGYTNLEAKKIMGCSKNKFAEVNRELKEKAREVL